MTEKTKKLFDAPWKVRVCEKGNPEFESVLVAKKTGWLVGRDMEYKTAKRVARLPELYDALREAAGGKCWSCAGENTETMLNHPCPKDCYVAKWRELLRKVRDGK